MPVPASINDLSTTAGSNSPSGSEGPQEGDNYIRSHASFIAQLRDKLNGTSPTGEINDATFAGTMAGAATWSALQTFAGGISATDGTFSGDLGIGDDLTVGGDISVTGGITGSGLSDTYTPTFTNVANTSALTAQTAQWMRIGSSVTVSGAVTVSCTAAGNTTTTFRVSLPIASNFTTAFQCAGSGARARTGEVTEAAAIVSDAANNAAEVTFSAGFTAAGTLTFTFTYRVV